MEDINWKKKYYLLIRELKTIETKMKNDRCPVFKQCCGGCLLIKDKLQKIKNDLLDNEEKW